MIADNDKLFSRLVNLTSSWPEHYRSKVKFMMHDVWYPPVRNHVQNIKIKPKTIAIYYIISRSDLDLVLI